MIYRIANILIEIKEFENEYLEHRLSAYLDPGTHPMPDITVVFKHNNRITVPEGTDYKLIGTWYWIDREGKGYTAIKQEPVTRKNLNRMDFDISCKNILIEYVNVEEIFNDITTDRVLHMILGDAFAFCQTNYSQTVLHSAAVSYKGQAVLFSAPSGTGKSTHTSLWKKFYPDDVVLFNDDTPVILEQDDKLYACGTPWSGKTEINENKYFPLTAIVFLKQGKENSIRPLSTVESVVKLLNETKKPVFEHLIDKHMEIITNIITKTPIYELTCNISKEAVDLVKTTIFPEE